MMRRLPIFALLLALTPVLHAQLDPRLMTWFSRANEGGSWSRANSPIPTSEQAVKLEASLRAIHINVPIHAMFFTPNVWFVRVNGGSLYNASTAPTGQCSGLVDADYPGSGIDQACAVAHISNLYWNGSYGNSAWVISGGDTVVIRGCHSLPSEQNPAQPACRIGWSTSTAGGVCQGVSAFWGCSIPPPPSGTSGNPTTIEGGCAYGTYTCNPVNTYPYTSNNLTQLFGGFSVGAVMYLSGSQYVDLEGLEITEHNNTCSTVSSESFPAGCSNSQPVSDFAKYGIIVTNTASNILLQDVYIHGLTECGICGPIGGPFTLTRVSIDFNAFAGWDFDDGVPDPDAPGSTLTQSYVSMVGNGCSEQYPIVNLQLPALACWDTNSGGFGDSWSGQAGESSESSDLASFTCDHCYIAYNTKDAALGPHTLLANLSYTNSLTIGNMGQQGKWGMQPNSTTVFTNDLIVGNCMRMSQQLPGAAQSFAQSSGNPGAFLTGFCRASGTVFDFFDDTNSTALFANNTFVTYAPSVFDFGCATANACNDTLKNNIILGYISSYSAAPFDAGQPPGLYTLDAGTTVTADHMIEYGIRDGDTCAGSILCVDPLFVNEPAQGVSIPPESVFDNFNFYLTSGSPAKAAGATYTGIPSTFYDGTNQTSPPTIGALGIGSSGATIIITGTPGSVNITGSGVNITN